VLIYAHRGASQSFPENSLEAFAEAVRLGIPGAELDLHATSDGVPVVIHDASLNRTAGIDADVAKIPFSRLRELAPFVPRFAEVLDLVGDTLHFDLEVKQPGIEAIVLETLANYPKARWSISSFDWTILDVFREHDRLADLWLLSQAMSQDLIDRAREIGGSAAALFAPLITKAVIQSAHDAGLKVMAWTVNDPARARELVRLGLDMLCTDAPHLFAGQR
jgi:glycerophosphoryl diester phosphodiesterase